jgi:hypothetical protein
MGSTPVSPPSVGTAVSSVTAPLVPSPPPSPVASVVSPTPDVVATESPLQLSTDDASIIMGTNIDHGRRRGAELADND